MQEIQSHEIVPTVKKNFLNGYSEEVKNRFNQLELWQKLQDQGCDEIIICEALKVSRATLFRWKKSYKEEELFGLESSSKKPHKIRQPIAQNRIKQEVLNVRRQYPLFGKEKIKIMLEKERGLKASVSTIGRVITCLINEGKIKHVNSVCGKRIRIERRKFNGHAKRFEFGMKAKELGEMIQVDHMTQYPFKHFAAICPISKLIYAYAYKDATAFTAADFL